MNSYQLPTGSTLLHNPRYNKGTAFTEEERRLFHIEGLLPPVPLDLQRQIARTFIQLDDLATDFQRYRLLNEIRARNETLFYAVVMSDPERFLPIIYTPTVGEACQKFNHFIGSPMGLYLPISAKGRVRDLLSNWPEKDVRFIVVTDGERILGLGDQGTGGMGIPLGKLALYTACGGVPPQTTLPILIDVGTNNLELLHDPLYTGLKQPRVRGQEYDDFIDEFVQAVQEIFPLCCIQWEDFANMHAEPILRRWQHRVCTFNDDMQGTAAVTLAGLYAALRITGGSLKDHKFLFLGAGSAAAGIAELITLALQEEGLSAEDALQKVWMYDASGLLTPERKDLAPFQRRFAHPHHPAQSFLEAIQDLQPTAIIGVSTVPKLFNQDVIRLMARINKRPIIFPLSNPTSRSECSAEEAYRWSDGRAVFASGSPFAPIEIDCQRFAPGQSNNVYIFPALAMAIYATGCRLIPEELFITAAKAVANQVTQEDLDLGRIYPPIKKIYDVSLQAAAAIAEHIFRLGLARTAPPDDLLATIQSLAYKPCYPSLM
ncbi:MAG: NAD-dependent malic enzyme [Chthoniobacterales bacterium]|nr:NAD-dependent malic enzyme [Chthoniobacterales bacterium]